MRVFEREGIAVIWKKEILSQNPAGMPPDEPKSFLVKQTDDQVLFYSIKQNKSYAHGEIWCKYFDSSIKENFITDILLFKEHKFFVTAHN
jgi:hypothetical protein